MFGHHRDVSETPFKWRFAGGPMMACLRWYFDPPSPYQLSKQQKKTKKLVRVGPPQTKRSGPVHVLPLRPLFVCARQYRSGETGRIHRLV